MVTKCRSDDDYKVAEQVVASLSRFLQFLIERRRWNLEGIVVGGSLSTGEYGFPPKDIDLVMITRFYDPTLDYTVRKAEEKAGNMIVKVNVGQYSLRDFNRLRTIFVTELKERGLWIYRSRKIKLLPRANMVYKYQALEIFMNFSVVKPLASISTRILTGDKKHERYANAISYACAKAYLGMATALLILKNKFRPSYRDRATIFCESFPNDYPYLAKRIPDLDDRVRWALNVKAGEVKNEAHSVDALRDLFDVIECDRQVLPTILSQSLSSVNNEEFLSQLSTIDRIPHEILNSIMYTIRLYLYYRALPPLTIVFTEPVRETYAASVLLLFALGADSSRSKLIFNKDYMQNAEKRMQRILPLRIPETVDQCQRWEILKSWAVSLNDYIVSQLHLQHDIASR